MKEKPRSIREMIDEARTRYGVLGEDKSMLHYQEVQVELGKWIKYLNENEKIARTRINKIDFAKQFFGEYPKEP